MVESATYSLYVDWDDDGDFLDANEDVSADLKHATVRRGFTDSLKRVAQTGVAHMLLDNSDGTYSPPLTANARPWREVRLDMTYAGTTTTLFRGHLDILQPTTGRFGSKRAHLSAFDDMRRLERGEGRVEMQTEVRAHELVEDIVAAIYTPASTSYEDGINVFETSVPNWVFREGDLTEEISAVQKLTEVCASDWGSFFIAGDGTPTFYNRHHIGFDDTVVLALDNDMLEMAYQQAADDVFNEVRVTVFPRAYNDVVEVLARLDQRNAPRIEAGGTLELTLYFRDTINDKVKIGGVNVIEPVASTDYEVTSDPEGEADDETGNVTVSSFTAYSDRADVILSNAAAHEVHVQRMRIRGTAVRSRERITVSASESGSGVPFNLRASLLSGVSEGKALAQHLLNRREDGIHDIRDVQIVANESAARMAMVRDAELLQRVTITEAQTGLSSTDGYIYWLEHEISRGQHLMRFHVGPVYDRGADPFRLGDAFNSGHVLIY